MSFETNTNNVFSKGYLIILCILAGSTRIKFGEIQVTEILIALTGLYFLSKIVIYQNFRFHFQKGLLELSKSYFLFGLFLFLLCLLNLRQPFYIPTQSISVLKLPLIISIVRIAQLFIVVSTFLSLASFFTRNPSLCIFTTKAYTTTAVVYSIYGVLSYFALKGGITIGGAYISDSGAIRVNGMANEGGPFGLYLVSSIVLTFFLRFSLKAITKHFFLVIFFFQLLALFLSSSKAGILSLIFIGIIYLLIGRINVRKLLLPTILVSILAFTLVKIYSEQFEGYLQGYNYLTNLSDDSIKSDDPNLVMGRIAGARIIPKIILEKPLIGVGIGNYSLVRNNPNYLDNLPAVDEWDLSGLGLFGNVAEFGIPLFIYFFLILLKPVKFAKLASKNNKILYIVSCFQIFAFGFGTQITFLYPWIVSSIGIGLSLAYINMDIPNNSQPDRNMQSQFYSPNAYNYN